MHLSVHWHPIQVCIPLLTHQIINKSKMKEGDNSLNVSYTQTDNGSLSINHSSVMISGSNITYEWNMTNLDTGIILIAQSQTTTVPTATFTATPRGNYSVTARASNNLSDKTNFTNIVVQDEVRQEKCYKILYSSTTHG